MRYIISDTHFGHDNIIEYTQRPFSSVEEMNSELVERWNEVVDEEDTVIHLGDVRHHPDPHDESYWFEQLNGNILLVKGNHDTPGQNCPVHTVNSATISHGRYQFYLEHQSVGFSGWQIHGHAHNNDTVNYPLLRPATQSINVSVELINYKPIALDTIVRLIEKDKRFEKLEDA